MLVKNDSSLKAAFQSAQPSLEAIDFQYGNLFKLELIAACKSLRSGKLTKAGIKASKIVDVIKKHLNLTVKVEIQPNYFGACTTFPLLNKNHPLLQDFREHWGAKYFNFEDDAMKVIDKKTTVLKGKVNLEKSRVEGIFSEVECTIWLGSELLAGNRFSDDEVAAVLCHELGHIFTYCEMVNRTTTTNVIMRSSFDALSKSKRREEKTAILEKVEETAGFKFDDKERLLDNKSKEAYETIILGKEAEKSRSELGENIYDLRGFEAMSDQFSTRHGFGVPLATGLDKIHRLFGHNAYWNNSLFYMVEVAKFTTVSVAVLAAIGGLYFAALLPLTVMLTNPLHDTYDKPGRRTERIRSQLVEELKDKGLPKARRNSILEDIEVIDTVLEDISDREGVAELYWKYFSFKGRKQADSINFQQEAEDLINNDLFVAAAELKGLGSNA